MLLREAYLKIVALSLAITLLPLCQVDSAAAAEGLASNATLLASVCPVVFPLDQFPTSRGNRYIFFGNAFFINDQGFLVTAAHVVTPFRYGGRPYILVETPAGGRRLQRAKLVAEDWVHDVAILQAIPNPFAGQHQVEFAHLTADRPSPGQGVVAVSLFPNNPRDPSTAETPVEIRSPGKLINYQFYDGEGGESEMLLFDHRVVPGQSGSPLLLADSGDVVGIVVGQWLKPDIIHAEHSSQSIATLPGAALNIHYAIALLRQQGISWHKSLMAGQPANRARQSSSHSLPVPISLVATPYPSSALFGDEVLLDAVIGANGRIANLDVVYGAAPFLKPALEAVRTWTFAPARRDGRAVMEKIGIVFQFPQSFLPKMTRLEQKRYGWTAEDSASHGALPLSTVEPTYPPDTEAEGSVILYKLIDAQGRVISTQVLQGVTPLTAAALAASGQWHFMPGKRAGIDTDSAVVLVITFRRP